MCYLTWFLGNILLFTQSKDRGPILTVLSKKKAAAGPAVEAASSAAGAGPGVGDKRGPEHMSALLGQLAHIAI